MEVTEQLLVCDGLEGVHFDAIPVVVFKGYHCIDGSHGVLLYDEVIGNQTDYNCINSICIVEVATFTTTAKYFII